MNSLSTVDIFFLAIWLVIFFLAGLLTSAMHVRWLCNTGNFPQKLLELNTKRIIQRNFKASGR